MSSQSIATQKSAFLTRQIRLLSNPLSAPLSKNIDLPNNVVADVTDKATEKVRQHNKLVYSAPTQRHIVEQIETLYWNSAGEDVDDTEQNSTVVSRATDLSDIKGAESLPEEWGNILLGDEEVEAEEAEQYAELRKQLLELNRLKDEAAQRLARCQKLQALLKPYENAQANIQPNLVTRDGEMSKELDRMRMLLVRVGARMGEHEKDEPNEELQEKSVGLTFDDKLRKVTALT